MVCNVVVTQELGGRWGGMMGEVGDCWCWLNRHPWQCFGITPQYSRFNATGATKMLEIYNGLDRHMRQCSGQGGEVCATHWWHPESTKVFTAPPPPLPPPPIVIFIYPYKGSEVASLSPKQISTGSLHGAACLVTDSYFIRWFWLPPM